MVYLKIESRSLSPTQISQGVGLAPDEAVAEGDIPPGSVAGRPLGWNRWVLREHGTASSSIDNLLSALHGRLVPVEDRLRTLSRGDCMIGLIIVAYHLPGDGASPGFHIGHEFIKLLAGIGAYVDVDQYVLREE
jgi:Domain of unknown function (DUF4279)